VSSVYTRPSLYPKQERAFFNDRRYSFIEATTKAGKTVGGIAWILEQAFAGRPGMNYWWVAPISQQADIAFRRVKQGLTPGSFVKSESPYPYVTVMSGPTIWFKSADNPDSLYGEDVFGALIDEGSRSKEESWYALRSTLTATKGKVRVIGNVKGRKNWFYRMCRMAEQSMSDPNSDMYYEKITALDAIEAGVIDAEEVESARRTLPENVFRELYMAEPSDDGGNPFGLDHILACVLPSPSPGPVVAWGLDLAKHQDWLVLTGLNDRGHVCAFHRWRGVPWRDSIKRIHQFVGEDTPCLVDSTGVGDPVLEELQHEHGNFFGYHFSPMSKQRLMEGLAVSIQSHEIGYPDGVIRQELENFEYDTYRTGIRYAAAEGMNDDCVISLGLARQMWVETAPGENVMKYYAQTVAEQKKKEELAPSENNRPWRPELVVTADDILDNELTQLYEQTMHELTPGAALKCKTCGQAVIGPSRVTDGEFIWHYECAGFGARAA
jgi:hypothetical protein